MTKKGGPDFYGAGFALLFRRLCAHVFVNMPYRVL